MSDTPLTDREQREIAIRHTFDRCILLENDVARLTAEVADLERWKREHLTVESWWKKIDTFVRGRPEIKLGESVSAKALEWLEEWAESRAFEAYVQRFGAYRKAFDAAMN